MKPTIIEKVKILPFSAKLKTPFNIASGSQSCMENILLIIELAGGIKGYGEAAPCRHVTGETQKNTLKNLKNSAIELYEKSVCDYQKISVYFRKKLAENMCALHAIETAVLDALTKHLKIPLWKFFGKTCTKIHSDMTVVLGSVEDANKLAKQIAKKGFSAFKIKIGSDFDADLKRTIAVFKTAPKMPIYLDGNEAYTAEEILKFLKELKKAGIVPAFLEQPVNRCDIEGLKKITRQSGLCVGADESISSLEDAVSLIKNKVVNAINIKPAKFGLLRSFEIARLCKAKNIKLMIGGMMESALSMTASAHMVSALGGFDFIDLDTPYFVDDNITSGFKPSPNGIYDLRDIECGIGVKI
jgi:L-alanine-DL-glutamate epimerase-like enolase superfamily enzyme